MQTAKDKIRVIVCRVGEQPKVEEIEPGLKTMQDIIGGRVERVALDGEPAFGRGIDLWCNEEFLIRDSQPNRLIRNVPLYRGELPIHGDFFIAAHDGEGETVSLTEAEAEEWAKRAKDWPMAFRLNNPGWV